MILLFTLTMPRNNAWDHKWSGDKRLYCRTRDVNPGENTTNILRQRDFSYDFGDGWCANISVRRIDRRIATRINQRTDGFCGYDWMIDSIIRFGEILTQEEVQCRQQLT